MSVISKEKVNSVCASAGLGELILSTCHSENKIYKCTVSLAGLELASASDMAQDSAETQAVLRALELISNVIDINYDSLMQTQF